MPFSGTGSLCSDSEDDPVNTSSSTSSCKINNISNETNASTITCQIIGNCEFVSIFPSFCMFRCHYVLKKFLKIISDK